MEVCSFFFGRASPPRQHFVIVRVFSCEMMSYVRWGKQELLALQLLTYHHGCESAMCCG